MKPLWSESRLVMPVMVCIAGALLLYAPFKAGIVSFSGIESKKDLIDSIVKIVGCAVLLLGGALSYIRFFKGRMLKPKIDLQMRTGFHPYGDKHLHWIEIAIENKGNVAVWNYTLKLRAIPYPGTRPYIDVSKHIFSLKREESENLVDVGETAFEHAVFELDKESCAFTFEALLFDTRGTMWRRCVTATNVEQANKNDQ